MAPEGLRTGSDPYTAPDPLHMEPARNTVAGCLRTDSGRCTASDHRTGPDPRTAAAGHTAPDLHTVADLHMVPAPHMAGPAAHIPSGSDHCPGTDHQIGTGCHTGRPHTPLPLPLIWLRIYHDFLQDPPGSR